ncbi:MAG: methyltransferase domain-containing protein [Gemmatimonadaceae bacterium]|nr:methyltransferase domain-containing protein [Gemmatimonadaceae bacterium]
MGKTGTTGRTGTTGGWWEGYFDHDYLAEFAPLFDPLSDRAQVGRIIELLGLPQGARVLDCPCGQGRHVGPMAAAGFDMTGADLSRPLLAEARRHWTGKRLRFVRADMRALPARWDARFDAVLNLFTSFGFFDDPADDQRVLSEFARVLRPGGTLLWHGGSRDGVMSRFIADDSWRGARGVRVRHHREFDPVTGYIHITTTLGTGARARQRTHRIRLYAASELARLARAAGLELVDAFDGWTDLPLTRRAPEMLLRFVRVA